MVREYSKNDIPFIIEGLKNFNIKISDNLFKNEINKFLICEENGIPKGFIQYSTYYDRVEIDYIWVSLKFRKKGLATQMMKKLFEICQNSCIINITLEVSEKNIGAIKFYQKMGFENAAYRNNYYGPGEKAILMIRRF